MKIAVLGRGDVGGGLADLWESAGHEVTRLGREGGDVSDADAVLIAEFVKARTKGPVAKSFNINFAALYDRLGSTSSKPSNLWSGDEEARETVERLSRDAGYEPVYAAPLEKASAQEQFLTLAFAINQGGMGPFFYRIAPPDQL